MPDIAKITAKLKDHVQMCEDYFLPDFMLVTDVVEDLSRFDSSQYDVFDILSREVIEKFLLPWGEVALKAGMFGLSIKTFGVAEPGGFIVQDHSHLIPRFEKLFNDWEKADWITITKQDDPECPIIVTLKCD